MARRSGFTNSIDINDPDLKKFRELEKLDLVDIVTFDGVGAENFQTCL